MPPREPASVGAEVEFMFLPEGLVAVDIHLKDVLAGTPIRSFNSALTSRLTTSALQTHAQPFLLADDACSATPTSEARTAAEYEPPSCSQRPAIASLQLAAAVSPQPAAAAAAAERDSCSPAAAAAVEPESTPAEAPTDSTSSHTQPAEQPAEQPDADSAGTLDTFASATSKTAPSAEPRAGHLAAAAAGPAVGGGGSGASLDTVVGLLQQLLSSGSSQQGLVIQPAAAPATHPPPPATPALPAQPASSSAATGGTSCSSGLLPGGVEKLLALELEVVQLQQSLQIAQLEFETRTVQIHSLKQRADEAEQRAQVAEQRTVNLLQQVQQLERQACELRGQLGEAAARHKQESAQLAARLAAACGRQQAAEQEAAAARQQLQAAQQAAEQERSLVQQAAREECARLRQAAQAETAQLKQAVAQAEGQCTQLQQAVAQAEGQCTQLGQAVEQAEAECAQLKEEAAQQAGWQERQAALEQDNQQLKAQLDVACGMLSALGIPAQQVLRRAVLQPGSHPVDVLSPPESPPAAPAHKAGGSGTSGGMTYRQLHGQSPVVVTQQQQQQQQQQQGLQQAQAAGQAGAAQAAAAEYALPGQQQDQQQQQPATTPRAAVPLASVQQQQQLQCPSSAPGAAQCTPPSQQRTVEHATPLTQPQLLQRTGRRAPPPQVPRLQLSSITLQQLQDHALQQQQQQQVTAAAAGQAATPRVHQVSPAAAAGADPYAHILVAADGSRALGHAAAAASSPAEAAVAAAAAAAVAGATQQQQRQQQEAAGDPMAPALPKVAVTAAQQELLASARQWQLTARGEKKAGDAVSVAPADSSRIAAYRPEQQQQPQQQRAAAACSATACYSLANAEQPAPGRPPRHPAVVRAVAGTPGRAASTPGRAAAGTPGRQQRKTYGQDPAFFEIKEAYNSVMSDEVDRASKWARSVFSSSSAVDCDPRRVEPMVQGLLQLFAQNGVRIPLHKCGPCQYRLGSAKLAVRLVNGRLMARSSAGQTMDVFAWLEKQPMPQ